MNLERSLPLPPAPGARDHAHASAAGTHDALRAALRPHTDESITPDRLPPMRSPLKQAVLLIAIYVAMYAATGLVIEVASAFADDVSSSFFAPVRDDGARSLRDIQDYASSDRDPACARA